MKTRRPRSTALPMPVTMALVERGLSLLHEQVDLFAIRRMDVSAAAENPEHHRGHKRSADGPDCDPRCGAHDHHPASWSHAKELARGGVKRVSAARKPVVAPSLPDAPLRREDIRRAMRAGRNHWAQLHIERMFDMLET